MPWAVRTRFNTGPDTAVERFIREERLLPFGKIAHPDDVTKTVSGLQSPAQSEPSTATR